MKTPCEVTVRYVLPYVRREIIKELADTYRLTQAEIARRFEVTDAAISMYMRSKRGSFGLIEASSIYKELRAEIKESARNIMEGGEVNTEACRLCGTIRRSPAFVRIYEAHMGEAMPICACRMCGSRPEYGTPTSAMIFDERARSDLVALRNEERLP